MKTNTFYKPKNEFGDELASKKLLNISIDSLKQKHNNELLDLDNKLSNQISNLDAKFDGEISSLENRPTFNFKIANPDVKIEEYIQQRWSECQTVEERETLKIEIGQTIYLRSTGMGYEEYVCTNPSDIDTDKSVISSDITFNRLGAVQAILASAERPGSVRLKHNLYDQTADEWNTLVTEETVYGIKNGNHLPKDGLAVAPCALYKFVQEDKRIEGDLKNLANEVKHISEEVLGVKDDAQTGLQNSRLDAHDAEINRINAKDAEQDARIDGQVLELEDHKNSIDEIKNIIGITGCCSNCNEEECSCGDCDGSLDCTIICKIKSMDDAITSNSDELARIDSEIVRIESDVIATEIRPAIEENAESINIINTTIGNKRDTNKNESIFGALNELDTRVSQNATDIVTNATRIDNVSQDVTTLRTDSFKEIGNHPEGAKYANTSLWHKVEEFDNEFTNTNKTISDNVTRIDNSIHLLGETVGNSTDNSSDTSATLHGKTNYLLNKVKENTLSIERIDSIVGNIGDSIETDTLCGKVKANTAAIKKLEETSNTELGKLNDKITEVDDSINSDNGIIATINEHAATLNEHTSQINDIETIANEAKATAEEIFAAHHVFNSLIVECDLPAEDEGKEGVEARIALHYSDICDIIEKNTGVKILPSNLSIIFNGARFTVEDNANSAEHFYPEVNYEGIVDADNNSHRALILSFAGYTEPKHVLISLTYYDNTVAQPSKINIIKIS